MPHPSINKDFDRPDQESPNLTADSYDDNNNTLETSATPDVPPEFSEADIRVLWANARHLSGSLEDRAASWKAFSDKNPDHPEGRWRYLWDTNVQHHYLRNKEAIDSGAMTAGEAYTRSEYADFMAVMEAQGFKANNQSLRPGMFFLAPVEFDATGSDENEHSVTNADEYIVYDTINGRKRRKTRRHYIIDDLGLYWKCWTSTTRNGRGLHGVSSDRAFFLVRVVNRGWYRQDSNNGDQDAHRPLVLEKGNAAEESLMEMHEVLFRKTQPTKNFTFKLDENSEARIPGLVRATATVSPYFEFACYKRDRQDEEYRASRRDDSRGRSRSRSRSPYHADQEAHRRRTPSRRQRSLSADPEYYERRERPRLHSDEPHMASGHNARDRSSRRRSGDRVGRRASPSYTPYEASPHASIKGLVNIPFAQNNHKGDLDSTSDDIMTRIPAKATPRQSVKDPHDLGNVGQDMSDPKARKRNKRGKKRNIDKDANELPLPRLDRSAVNEGHFRPVHNAADHGPHTNKGAVTTISAANSDNPPGVVTNLGQEISNGLKFAM